MAKINISIPQPCHENWETMTPSDRGRFCASCQKNVVDFNKASDREIVTAFQKDSNLCSRFLNSQLNRDLVKPEKKNPVWLATFTAFISLFGLNEAVSQEKVPTEQTDNRALGKYIITEPKPTEIEVSGVVSDKTGPLPGATVTLKRTGKSVQTDIDGNYKINAEYNDILIFSFVGVEDKEIVVDANIVNQCNNQVPLKTILEGAINGFPEKKRTFLGKIFHRIGNLFR